jgi:ADP-ribosylglycohydrolase
MTLRRQSDYICEYVEEFQFKHAGNIQITTEEIEHILNFINMGIKLHDQLEHAFHAYMEAKEQNEIVYNHVMSKGCFHFNLI